MKKIILILLFAFFGQNSQSQNALDNAGLNSNSPAKAAYSLRLLSSSYSGYAIQVRRTSDFTTLNIGFTSNGDLDTATMKTFVGSNSGFVSIWYDQSGYSKDAVNSTASSQPRIMLSGVIDRNNGNPAVYFAGANFLGLTTGFPVNADYSLSAVVNQTSSSNQGTIIGDLNGAYHVWWYNTTTSLNIYHNTFGNFGTAPSTPLNKMVIQSARYINSSRYAMGYSNGLAGTGTVGNTNSGTGIEIGGMGGAGWNLIGYINEAIVLTNAFLDTTRQNLETNQQNYYKVSFIATQPSTTAQVLTSGATASTISVSATGPGLTYQWYINSTNSNTGGSAISGATSNSYTPSTSISGVFYYYVVVSTPTGYGTSSNVSGSITVMSNLDKVGISTVTSAFSLRLLSSTYNGYAIQVRRSSDNTYQNIGFTANGDLDTSAIKTFVGSNSGFISIWYDQSGFQNNQIMVTNGNQPRIMLSGVVDRNNGIPAAYFTPSYWLACNTGGFPVNSDYTISVVVNQTNTNWSGAVVGAVNSSRMLRYNGNAGLDFYHCGDYAQGLNALLNKLTIQTGKFIKSSNLATMYTNGAAGTSQNTNSGCTFTDNTLQLGAFQGGNQPLTGYISEAIVLPSAINDSIRGIIESNQQTYYGIAFIAIQPSTAAQVLTIGASATALSVSANGPNLTYQWYKNTTNANTGGTAISGATSNSYTPPTAIGGVSYYYVVVTSSGQFTVASNVSGSVTVKSTLDKVGLPSSINANSAYSLRLLSTTYSGNAIQVRRSSDNTLQDIGFTSNGDLDTASLKTFVGSGSGFIATWYDQSGNVNNVTQPTVASQPRIMLTGVVDRSHGIPAVYFNGSYYIYNSTSTTSFPMGNTDYTLSVLVNQTSFATYGCLVGSWANSHMLWFQSSNPPYIQMYHNTYGNFANSSTMPLSKTAISTFRYIYSQRTGTFYTNGVTGVLGTGNTNNISNEGTIVLGAGSSGGWPLTGYIPEVICMSTTINDSIKGILESNQQTYYGIAFIATHPSTTAQVLNIGASATALSVSATGPNLTYQWYKNLTNTNTGGTAISGATSSSYSPSTAVGCLLYYYVVVTSSNQFSITSNVSGSVTVKSTLDKVGLPSSINANSAYSLRLLSTTYTGNAIQVRRSSDNTLQDIGFTSNGDLDTASLKTFVGSGSGFIATWYDQSGNVNHVTQPTAANQPRIMLTGVVDRSHGIPAVYFNGSYYIYNSTSTTSFPMGNTDYTLSVLVNQTTISNVVLGSWANSRYLFFQNTNPPYLTMYHNTYGGFATSPIIPLSKAAINTFRYIYSARTGTFYTNGIAGALGVGNTNNISNEGTIVLGAGSSGGSPLIGYIPEVICMSNTINDSIKGILESNQQTYYGIVFIATQPSTTAQLVTNGAIATALSVSATGPNLTYQWYSNLTNSNIGGTLVSGATSSSYSPSTSVGGLFYYYVVVTSSGQFSVTSNVSGSVTVKSTLDKAGLPSSINVNSAYSLRLLSNAYNGNAIQVRRSSDNTLQNIGFTSNGDLDTASLKTFVGSGNGFIATWYDQSGNLNHITQPTIANQPRIILSGVVDRSHGIPAVYFNGSYYIYNNTSTTSFPMGNTDYTLSVLVNQTSISNVVLGSWANSHYLFFQNTNPPYLAMNHNTYGSYATSPIIPLSKAAINTFRYIYSARTGTFYTNGIAGVLGTGNTNNISNEGTIVLGAGSSGGSPLIGYIPEVICMSTTINDSIKGILESNQQTYYGIVFIATQPSTTAQILNIGATATPYSVLASGPGLTYQWYKNLTNSNTGGVAISGETSNSYTPPTSNSGLSYFYVVVTAPNGYTITSNTTGSVSVISILNKVGLTGTSPSTAAYALRQLSSNYNANTINVRRSSDFTTLDIGFTSNGDLDTATLKTFVGSGNGYITTWYDQSGYGNNAIQATQATQPQIMNSGYIYRINALPAVYFAGAQYLNSPTGFTANSDYTLAAVANQTSTSTAGSIIGGTSGSGCGGHILWFQNTLIMKMNHGGTFSSGLTVSLNQTAIHSAKFVNSTKLGSIYTNGTIGTPATGTCVSTDLTVQIGASGNGNNLTGYISEVFVMPSALADTSRQNLVVNQANYFNILIINTQPSTVAQYLNFGNTATPITVSATGPGLNYQWYSNISNSNSGGTVIVGATSASYTPPTTTGGTKYYYVVVSSTNGSSLTSNVSGLVNIAASTNANLTALTLSSGSLTPSFAALTMYYAAGVTNSVSSITVTPTAADSTATIQVNVNSGAFTTVTTGTASPSLALNVGNDTVLVKLTAQDGTTIKTYAIYLTRSAGIVNNTITASQSICSGNTPTPLTGSTPTGGTGSFTYSWLASTTSANTGFAVASGTSSGINYSPSALTQSTWYRRLVLSGSLVDSSAAIKITANTVITNDSITSGSQIICNGSIPTTLTGSTPAGGDGASYSYKWLRSTTSALTGYTSAGLNDSAINYTSTAISANTWFRRRVISGLCASDTSPAISITANPLTTITTQPINATVCAGISTTFTVVATGTGTLTYQWKKAGTNITGATSSTYTISSPSVLDTAGYCVVVTGTCSSVTSNIAYLILNIPVIINTQPTSATVCAGTNTTFTVSAFGTGSLTYQWKKSGTNIIGATSSTYNIPSPVFSDTAAYSVVITGTCGSITSNSANLILNAPTLITTQPTSPTICIGTSTTFTVAATGLGTLTYQWKKAGFSIMGATSSSYTISSPAISDTGVYSVTVTGTCGSINSNNVTLNLYAPTIITSQPTTATICIGTSNTFSVSATGSGTLSYQWKKAGVNITGATASSYVISSSAISDTGSYSVIVTSGCGSVTSNNVNLLLSTPTSISTQPTSATVCAGTSTSFTVSALGAGTLTYQWKKGGTNISGATSSSFTISNPSISDTAAYSVVVTGTCGSVTSSNANLNLNTPTTILTQPLSATICIGVSDTFRTTAIGTGTLTYQWKKAGFNIMGATAASYIIASPAISDTGSFTVLVSATCGSVTSNSATLNLYAPTTIVTQPTSATVCAGTSTTFNVAASGTGTLAYQWKKAGVNITGATASSYTISNPSISDTGTYSVSVNGSCGTITSANASLFLNTATAISTQPTSSTLCAGTSKTFTVGAIGTGTLTYQWKKAGVNISGATASSYTISSPSVSDTGVYTVLVTGTCGSLTSANANLILSIPTAITTQPISSIICTGTSDTFNVVATGTGTLTYQWKKAGFSIIGATASRYIISNPSISDTGYYSVVVTGTCGSVSSANASLNVYAPTAIATQPTSVIVCAGTNATFTVAANGTGTITYQWKKAGVNITGATSSSYTVISPSLLDTGAYSVVVTASCGSVTSTTVNLNLNTPTAITTQPSSITQCQGTNSSFSVSAVGTGTIYYQWKKSGVSILGATNSTFNIDSIQVSNAGSYTVDVAGTCGSVTSNTTTLTVNPSLIASVIVSSSSTSVCGGSSIIYTATPTNGGTTPHYQWKLNRSNVGTDTSIYTQLIPMLGDTVYVVLVSNAIPCLTVSTANSNSIILTNSTVTPTVSISSNSGTTICSGTVVTYTATGSSTGNAPSYQWRVNGIITGDTTSILRDSLLNNGDTVKVTLTSNAGCTTTPTALSNNIVMAVNAKTTITSQPTGTSICAGNSVTFNVSDTGSGTITFQWTKGGNNITGANSSSFTIASPSLSDTGMYRVVVSGNCGIITSDSAKLNLNAPTSIITQPISKSTCAGTNTTFSVLATGTGILTYQWLKSGVQIPGGVYYNYTISNPTISDTGSYSVIVKGACDSVISNNVNLNINSPLVVTSQPTNANVCIGSDAVFNVAATGTGTVRYQWKKSSVNISGATSSSLTINNVTTIDTALYSVLVSDTCGNVLSNVAVLSINAPYVWVGSTSANWSDSSNWSCPSLGLPKSITNVTIPPTIVSPRITDKSFVHNINIQAGAILTLDSTSSQLSVFGNITNTGTFVNTNGHIIFTGSTKQTIPVGNYAKVSINNSADVAIGGDVIINDSLILNSGKVNLANYNLTLGSNSYTNSGKDLSYIVTSGLGKLTINNVGSTGKTGSIIVPIGNSSFNPVTLTNTGTTDDFTFNVLDTITSSFTGNTPSGVAITSYAVNRAWVINEATSGGSNATVKLQWAAKDEMPNFVRNNSYVEYYNSGKWNTATGNAALGNNPYTQTVSSITNFTAFAVATKNSTGLPTVGNTQFNKSISISAQPNPFNANLSILITKSEAENVSIQIMDMTGRIIATQKTTVIEGENLIEIENIDQLKDGMYFINVITQNSVITQKVIKQQ